MIQRWERLSFVHRPYEPDAVRALLPSQLEVDTFDGAAWVGIVPFRLTLRLPWTPAIPWVSRFAETNVRTYVVGPDGRRGIWFLSLDAARLGPVLVARATYRLPYLWASMGLRYRSREIRYVCDRHRSPATLRLALRAGGEVASEDLTELERFLTCRWRLYSPAPMPLPPTDISLLATQVEHEPWPIRRAAVLELEESLSIACGLPANDAAPLAHCSAGVRARFAPRTRVGDETLSDSR